MAVFQAQCPNSRQNFLIKARDKALVHQAFPISCYQVKYPDFTQEENEALADFGDSVAAGEIDSDDCIVGVLKHRFSRVADVCWNGRVVWD
ncbi:hypothetical protein [Anabaena azotica]|uniref:Uncharacterized protein n=1 Tax=Anabaena azotica FACHB-119 TaxID=947527 RepID=A0ABR8DA18_9NOST|nr:hypothetical protein [Anabaena azotica]MBD2503969.1 hypothetical protein [Anabaena azotica FACHB-119]